MLIYIFTKSWDTLLKSYQINSGLSFILSLVVIRVTRNVHFDDDRKTINIVCNLYLLQQKPPEAPIQVKTEVKIEPVIETEEVVVTTESQDKLSTEIQDKIPIFKNPTFVVFTINLYFKYFNYVSSPSVLMR